MINKAACCAALSITIVIPPSNAPYVTIRPSLDFRSISYTFHAQANFSIAMKAVLGMDIQGAHFRGLTSQTRCAISPNLPMHRSHMANTT